MSCKAVLPSNNNKQFAFCVLPVCLPSYEGEKEEKLLNITQYQLPLIGNFLASLLQYLSVQWCGDNFITLHY